MHQKETSLFPLAKGDEGKVGLSGVKECLWR